MTTDHMKKALVIGVSDYEDPSLEKLSFCKNDGEEMCSVLTSIGFDIPEDNKLFGSVKEKEMKERIANFFTNPDITSQHTLLFYFSGHGVPDTEGDVYLATSELNSKWPMIGGFPFLFLTKFMNSSLSTRVISILDCCYSGGSRQLKEILNSSVIKGTIAIQTEQPHSIRAKENVSWQRAKHGRKHTN